MSTYVLAQLQFTDIERYRRYHSAFGAVFAKSGAKLLCADESPQILEGNWIGDKVVLMEFQDERHAMGWLQSPEYLKIAEDRKSGATTTALMLKALPLPD